MTKHTRFNLTIALSALGLLIILALAATWLKPVFRERQAALTEKQTATVFTQASSEQAVFPGQKVERDPKLSNEQNLLRDYLANNLSDLSPTKEELGGKFYLTKINFTAPNEAVIDYEDGHNALQAKINYTLSPEELKINAFEIIKQ